MDYIKINELDNVAVLLKDAKKGDTVFDITLLDDIKSGHKMALADIKKGQPVIKYGAKIGICSSDIKAGEHVHSHNLKTALNENELFEYHKISSTPQKAEGSFYGYKRSDNKVGIRNEIWIIPTVGCINSVAKQLEQLANEFSQGTDGVYALCHPLGCSQLSDDAENTQKLLLSLCMHPNASGVLLLGLGCENNLLSQMKEKLTHHKRNNIMFLNCQDCEDEISEGLEKLKKLIHKAQKEKREKCDISDLVIGLKCGGSDGFSGLSANPLVGNVCDLIAKNNGTCIMTEIPEMFGAEQYILNRCEDEQIFNKAARMINNFKNYYSKNDQPIYENPSPGNKQGGITTLEEKSLGCVQKGGSSEITNVINYGECNTKKGVNILYAPGNDLISSTALCAAGAQLILFTTGRGTPFSSICPTVKISTNTPLYEKKPHWIDFDAGRLLYGENFSKMSYDLFSYILSVANGEKTKGENFKSKEIHIFKTGVTL